LGRHAALFGAPDGAAVIVLDADSKRPIGKL
jgi:hypothetical protein